MSKAGMDINEIIGRFTVGAIVGVGTWIFEVLIGVGWGSSYADDEMYMFSLDRLVSPSYLAAPIIFGLLTMIFPMLLTRFGNMA